MKKYLHHKYKAKPQTIEGIRYDSKKEARYAGELKIRKMTGEITFYLRQTAFHLPGNVTYRLDFMEFHSDGSIHYIDVKGYDTPMSKLKRKQVEALYPIKIEIK